MTKEEVDELVHAYTHCTVQRNCYGCPYDNDDHPKCIPEVRRKTKEALFEFQKIVTEKEVYQEKLPGF